MNVDCCNMDCGMGEWLMVCRVAKWQSVKSNANYGHTNWLPVRTGNIFPYFSFQLQPNINENIVEYVELGGDKKWKIVAKLSNDIEMMKVCCDGNVFRQILIVNSSVSLPLFLLLLFLSSVNAIFHNKDLCQFDWFHCLFMLTFHDDSMSRNLN